MTLINLTEWDKEQVAHYADDPWDDARIDVSLSRRDLHYLLTMLESHGCDGLRVRLDKQERHFIVAALKHWSHTYAEPNHIDLIGYMQTEEDAACFQGQVQAICDQLKDISADGFRTVPFSWEALEHINHALEYVSSTPKDEQLDASYDECFDGIDIPRAGKFTILFQRINVLVDTSDYSEYGILSAHLYSFLSDESDPDAKKDVRDPRRGNWFPLNPPAWSRSNLCINPREESDDGQE